MKAAAEYQLNEADVTLNSVVYADRTLLGFATVRDLGDGLPVTIARRNAINTGRLGERVGVPGNRWTTSR